MPKKYRTKYDVIPVEALSYTDVIAYLMDVQNRLEDEQKKKKIGIVNYHRLQDEWLLVDNLMAFLRNMRHDKYGKG